jgi:hypothetical protein
VGPFEISSSASALTSGSGLAYGTIEVCQTERNVDAWNDSVSLHPPCTRSLQRLGVNLASRWDLLLNRRVRSLIYAVPLRGQRWGSEDMA